MVLFLSLSRAGQAAGIAELDSVHEPRDTKFRLLQPAMESHTITPLSHRMLTTLPPSLCIRRPSPLPLGPTLHPQPLRSRWHATSGPTRTRSLAAEPSRSAPPVSFRRKPTPSNSASPSRASTPPPLSAGLGQPHPSPSFPARVLPAGPSCPRFRSWILREGCLAQD